MIHCYHREKKSMCLPKLMNKIPLSKFECLTPPKQSIISVRLKANADPLHRPEMDNAMHIIVRSLSV